MASQIMELQACALNHYFRFLVNVSVPTLERQDREGKKGEEKRERKVEKPLSYHFLEPETAWGLCL